MKYSFGAAVLHNTCFLTVLCSVVWAVGCGKGSDSGGEQPFDLPIRVFEPPASYPLTDPNCQSQTEKIDLTVGTIPAWQADRVQMVQVNLANTFTAASLRNAVVKDTVFGVEYERRCDDAKESGKKCLDQFGGDLEHKPVKGKGWLLRLCNNAYEYPRKSVETVALTSAHYLDLAHQTYLRLKEPTASVPPELLLNVLPVFTDIYDNFYENGEQKIRKEYIVNNLAYYGGSNMIIVFPASQESDASLPGFFWESQFVLGHEYGHHVERQRIGSFKEALGVDWNPITHSWEDTSLHTFSESGTSEFTQILGAVSEGFADLIAFYAEGGTSHSLTGIPILGQNRDIRLDKFRNNTEKSLSQSRLNLLTGRTQASNSDADKHFEYIHTVGAVLAHAANRVFKSVSLARSDVVEGSKEDIEYRYKLLLQWIDHTGAGLSLVKFDPAETHLEQISHAFAKAINASLGGISLRADTTEKQLQADVCTILSETLPALSKPAFSLASGGC